MGIIINTKWKVGEFHQPIIRLALILKRTFLINKSFLNYYINQINRDIYTETLKKGQKKIDATSICVKKINSWEEEENLFNNKKEITLSYNLHNFM